MTPGGCSRDRPTSAAAGGSWAGEGRTGWQAARARGCRRRRPSTPAARRRARLTARPRCGSWFRSPRRPWRDPSSSYVGSFPPAGGSIFPLSRYYLRDTKTSSPARWQVMTEDSNALADELDARLANADTALAAAYPGDRGRRQPVHTVYRLVRESRVTGQGEAIRRSRI